MFELPSLWNFIASTLAFIITAWYIGRHMDEREMQEGRARSILVFTLASAVSWGAGEAADKMAGTPPATHSDLSQMIKAISGPQS
jgi:hypothetical protein